MVALVMKDAFSLFIFILSLFVTAYFSFVISKFHHKRGHIVRINFIVHIHCRFIFPYASSRITPNGWNGNDVPVWDET